LFNGHLNLLHRKEYVLNRIYGNQEVPVNQVTNEHNHSKILPINLVQIIDFNIVSPLIKPNALNTSFHRLEEPKPHNLNRSNRYYFF
jgi:hypothetical protein